MLLTVRIIYLAVLCYFLFLAPFLVSYETHDFTRSNLSLSNSWSESLEFVWFIACTVQDASFMNSLMVIMNDFCQIWRECFTDASSIPVGIRSKLIHNWCIFDRFSLIQINTDTNLVCGWQHKRIITEKVSL